MPSIYRRVFGDKKHSVSPSDISHMTPEQIRHLKPEQIGSYYRDEPEIKHMSHEKQMALNDVLWKKEHPHGVTRHLPKGGRTRKHKKSRKNKKHRKSMKSRKSRKSRK
jgi:hypothetical protein